MIRIDGSQSDRSAQFCREIGTIAMLMQRTERYRFIPIGGLGLWVRPPVLLKQVRIFFSEDKGLPVAFMTWALLSEATQRRWSSEPRRPFHPSEWNEGRLLCIIDFVALQGYASSVIDYAHCSMFQGHSFARSVRHQGNGQVRKVTEWRRRRTSASYSGSDMNV